MDKRVAGAERVGKHKTSMLQDVEAGKVLEVDAIVGSVIEMGVLTQTPTPTITAIYSACKLLNHMLTMEGMWLKGQKFA